MLSLEGPARCQLVVPAQPTTQDEQAAADLAERFGGTDGDCCRILVGMQKPPKEQMREAYRAIRANRPFGEADAKPLYRQAVESFRAQIAFGVPTNETELALQRLAQHLRAGKVRVCLCLRGPLHARLCLIHRADPVAPPVGVVESMVYYGGYPSLPIGHDRTPTLASPGLSTTTRPCWADER